VVHDSEETLQLAQESRDKMKQMKKEMKPTNYTKINHLSGVFVPQKALSREELYFANNSKTTNVSKSFLIPNEDLSDDTTLSVACKFLNEEAAKFVGDFKSLAKEANDSLAKHKVLELEIERLLKAVLVESRPPMLNKENYVPWSSRLLRYAKSRPNGKLIHNSILNGPYVRKMIPEPGDANRDITDYGFELTGFSDADYAGCKDTFKSTFGGAQFLGEKLLAGP
nr:uncharacterized mitochondrial protein AtMg00810-like [Tanacetum cinerariifolium]